MQQQSNTGWYVLGGIALLMVIAHNMGKPGNTTTGTPLPADSSAAPDTASSPEIIITSTGK